MSELKPCKCGSPARLVSKANGNMAGRCTNPECKYHKPKKSWFVGSERAAADAWNCRVGEGEKG